MGKEQVRRQTVFIDVEQNPYHRDLLEQGYEAIFKKQFPKEEDQITLQIMKERVLGNPHPDIDYVFCATGRNLNKPGKAIVEGLSIALYYKLSNTGLFAYGAVRRGLEGYGMGRVMFEERQKALHLTAERYGRMLDGLYVEFDDPSRTKKSSMDPRKRIQVYEKMGAQLVPIVGYVEPPMDGFTDRTEGLVLYSFPVEGRHPSNFQTIRHLRAMFMAVGRKLPEHDPDFQSMEAQLLTHEFGEAALPVHVIDWAQRQKADAPKPFHS